LVRKANAPLKGDLTCLAMLEASEILTLIVVRKSRSISLGGFTVLEAVVVTAFLAVALCTTSPAPAGSIDTRGQFVGTVSPAIKTLLSQFPKGGPNLQKAITRAVTTDPSLAADAYHAANADQKEYVVYGLDDAARALTGSAREQVQNVLIAAGGQPVCEMRDGRILCDGKPPAADPDFKPIGEDIDADRGLGRRR